MTRTTRVLVASYLIVAHALAAFVYWQNATFRDELAATSMMTRLAAGAPLSSCPPGSAYQERIVAHLVAAHDYSTGDLYLLGDSIVAQMPPLKPVRRAHNLGIAGDTSAGLLYRALRYPFMRGAHAVVVHIGINDVLRDDIGKTLANITDTLAALGDQPRIVLSAMLPVAEAVVGRALNVRIEALNTALRKLCDANARCSYVDGWQLLADEQGQLDRRYHNGDGIHLSAQGYQLFVSALTEKL